MMNKHIRSAFLLDEAITFLVVKPLNSSIFMITSSFLKNFNVASWRMPF